MKNNCHVILVCFVVFMSIFLVTGCEEAKPKTDVNIDYESEGAAILQVLESESEAFWKKDFEAYASHWVHEDYIRTLGWWQVGGVTVVEGWDERAKRTKAHMQESPLSNETATKVRRININLRIYDEVAWMTFDQYGLDTGDSLMDMPGLSRETRIFEKKDGEWKIAYLGWLLEGE